MSTSSTRIKQIAELLGLPIEALLDTAPPNSDFGDAHELIRLWLLIRSADDRRTVLEGIRKVVEAQSEVP